MFSTLDTAIVKNQQSLTTVLANKLAKLNEHVVYLLLSIYFLGFGGACIYIAITAFKDKKNVMFFEPLRVNKHISIPGDVRRGKDYLITQQQFNHIQNLKKYLDSLQQQYSKTKLNDNVIVNQKHIDSIDVLQKLTKKTSLHF